MTSTTRIHNSLLNLALSYTLPEDIGKLCTIYQWPAFVSAETEIVRSLVQVDGGAEIDLEFFALTETYRVWRDGVEIGGVN
jgi:hypothetical protein